MSKISIVFSPTAVVSTWPSATAEVSAKVNRQKARSEIDANRSMVFAKKQRALPNVGVVLLQALVIDRHLLPLVSENACLLA